MEFAFWVGGPDGIRTRDLPSESGMSLTTRLRGHTNVPGSSDGDRTRVSALRGRRPDH